MATKWYEESPGVVSSKRLAGVVCSFFGLAAKLTLFVMALFGAIGDAATASSVSDGLLYGGLGLLGVMGVADAFKRGDQ